MYGLLIHEENTGYTLLTFHLADCKDIALDILDKCLLSLQGTEKKKPLIHVNRHLSEDD